jgi:endonuclease/exonuclease/phosphatase family metal-dependent hydrolase
LLRYLFVVALSFLWGCMPNDTLVVPQLVAKCEGPTPAVMRIGSYNVKSGKETSLEKVGDTIEEMSPDILALQEIDVGNPRTGRVDQARALSDRLGTQFIYAAALSHGEGTYGIALLSRYPIMSVKRINLRARWAAEPRVAIDATVCVGSMPMRIITTHADVWAPMPNITELAAQLPTPVNGPTLVLGDFNVKPDEPEPRLIEMHGLTDLIGKFSEGPTFWADNKRIDYLFADASLTAHAIGAQIGTSKASDHHPVWADFHFAQKESDIATPYPLPGTTVGTIDRRSVSPAAP